MTSGRGRQAASFGPVADAYARGRPSYPVDAVRWLLEGASGPVLDLAAGTGLLTAVVAEVAAEVVAVDPSEEMLDRLRGHIPGVRTEVGSAERIPLPDASVGAVLAGQAAHWFDFDRAVPELARVIRPGGTVGLLWNLRDMTDPFAAEVARLLASAQPDTLDHESWRRLESLTAGSFTAFEHRTFPGHRQRLDRDGLTDMARSKSYLAVLPDDERAARLAGFAALADRETARTGEDTVVLPYLTEVFLARRKD